MNAVERKRTSARLCAASFQPRRMLAARISRSTAGTRRARNPAATKSSAPAFIAAAATLSPNWEETMMTGSQGEVVLISRSAVGPSSVGRSSSQIATSQASGFNASESASCESTRWAEGS